MEVISMADTGLIQVRVDENLKKEVTEIYDALGIDMPTAIRMFLKKSKMVRGIPFDTTLPEDTITKTEAMNIFNELRKQAADVPEMTLEEINEEINSVRNERKAAKQ